MTTTPPISRQQAGLLVAAPLIALLARVLTTPQYQDEADRPDSARYLAEVATAGTRNDVGAMLTLLSAVLYVGAALALWSIVRTRMPRLGLAGVALTVAGTFGLAAVSTQVLLAGRFAEEADRDAMVALLDRLNASSQLSIFFLALVAGAIGSILLAIGLYRSRVVPRAAAVIAGVGGAGLMVTAPGPLASFVIGAAVVAVAGLGWTAVAATTAVPERARTVS